MFDDIFVDGKLKKFLLEKSKDIWKNTNFEGYVLLNPRQKGTFGKMFVEKYLTLKGHTVEPRKDAGHDRIIDDVKTEIKFGVCNKGDEDCFIINHISKEKDWERLIFFGINLTEQNSRLIWFTKEDFYSELEKNNDIFNHQQGGKKIKNDDYMCSNIKILMKQSFVKQISDWPKKTTLIDFI